MVMHVHVVHSEHLYMLVEFVYIYWHCCYLAQVTIISPPLPLEHFQQVCLYNIGMHVAY